jgi:outer membrane protein assembly factor BamE (lipoprotein component of BamABCDE complex)
MARPAGLGTRLMSRDSSPPRIAAARFGNRLPVSVFLLSSLLAVAGCNSSGGGPSFLAPPEIGLGPIGETTQHGYVVSEMALQQIPVGSSRDQVLIALGSPSTTGHFGGEVFYYISQTKHRSAEFLQPKVVDQRVLAIYFDGDADVARIANYGLQDGKVFDFHNRITPTGGADVNFVGQILRARPQPFG